MTLPEFGSSDADAATDTALLMEDPLKKIRKPYTITKCRESWTEPEHDKFLEAIQLFDRDWKKIGAYVGSKTVIQIRSHAQKYFLKAEKNGTGEHIPPPRPKRKAAHPYPQKASRNMPSQVLGPFQPSFALHELEHIVKPDSSSVLVSSISGVAMSSREDNSVQAFNFSQDTKVLPDFGQVYGFIGSVFDPKATDHLRKLKMMDPIDVETVMLLMRNLSINLASPDFEDHKRVLSSYEIE